VVERVRDVPGAGPVEGVVVVVVVEAACADVASMADPAAKAKAKTVQPSVCFVFIESLLYDRQTHRRIAPTSAVGSRTCSRWAIGEQRDSPPLFNAGLTRADFFALACPMPKGKETPLAVQSQSVPESSQPAPFISRMMIVSYSYTHPINRARRNHIAISVNTMPSLHMRARGPGALPLHAVTQ
jgi:hypothetical protein